MLNCVISAFIYIFLLINVVVSEQNATELFELYKYKYNRVYGSPKTEYYAFSNFMNNMNNMKAAEMKANSTGTGTIYKLNIYADQDPEEVNEHYGVNIDPYENIINGTKKNKRTEKALEDMHMYDLDKVNDLYKDWKKKWGTHSGTKLVRIVRYYRFIKTVADINKKRFKGEDANLGQDADVVQNAEEFFYG